MRINRIEIANFKPFKFPNIKKFEADIEDDIQVLIGQSGSSKTSVLNEITTFATLRSIFEKNGYKKIDLEHEGDIYTLISDFKNKNKVHSFIKNGEELNIGGTQPVQQELVEKYFNFTPLVRDILYNNILMCSLSKADRKSLLLKINPVDLSLVIEKHKLVCSKIREYKSNLNLLYRRKQEIEAQMLSKEVLEEKQTKLNNLKNKLQEFSTDEYFFNHQLELLKKQRSTLNITNFQTSLFNLLRDNPSNGTIFERFGLTSLQQEVNKFSYKYPLVDKSNKDKVNELKILLSSKNQEVNHFQQDIKRLLSDIDNANKHLQEINNSNNINILEVLLKELEKEYQEYKDIEEPKVKIEPYEYNDYLTFRVNISEAITKFLELHIPNKIVPVETLNRCKQKLSEIEYNYLREYKGRVNKLEQEIKQIDESISRFPNEPKEILEQCDLCDYRRIYITQVATLKNRKEKLIGDIAKYNKILVNYENGYAKLKDYTYLQEQLYIHVNAISHLLDFTNFRISKNNLITRLNDNPNKFLNIILGIIDIYPKIYKKKELEKKISEVRSQLEVMEKTNLPSIDFIKDIINKCNKEIAINNKELFKVEQEIEVINYDLSGYTNYEDLVNKCYYISQLLNDTYNFVYTEASIYYYTTELQKLLSSKNEVIYKLNNLEKELKEQEILLARYEEEVVKLINSIEEELKLLKEIEFGLSPSTGFPHKNMIEYLNVLINNVNCILESVWSYPMQLIPLTINDELDYSFKVRVDDVEISDISRLSRGQQTITNVAFTISFILNMGLTNYPIFFDEAIEGLDMTHTQRALEWLKEIVDNKYVSQMFFVNHDAVMNSGFDSAGVICLMPDNISVPDHANRTVKIS